MPKSDMHFKSPIQCVLEATYPKVKRIEREVDHSFPTTVEVKNEWNFHYAPAYTFITYTKINSTLNFYVFSIFFSCRILPGRDIGFRRLNTFKHPGNYI